MRTIFESGERRNDAALTWFSRAMRLTTVLGGLCSLTLVPTAVPAVENVTLAWDQSTDPAVAGYNVYYGGASRTYTSQIAVGPTNIAVIPGLVAGMTYYFAATAYSFLGVESLLSAEVFYTLPTLTGARLQVTSTRPFVLVVTGSIGRTYEIQTTQDLITWAVAATGTVGADGSVTFMDMAGAKASRRFYRAREMPR